MKTTLPEVRSAAAILGRLGGKAGTGKAKARTRAQAQAAARKRWALARLRGAQPVT